MAQNPEFEALFRHAPIPIYFWVQESGAFDPVLADFNNAAVQMTSGRISELLGKHCSDLYQNDSSIIQDFRDCFESREPVFRRMRYQLRSTGVPGYFRVAYIPISSTSIAVAVVPE